MAETRAEGYYWVKLSPLPREKKPQWQPAWWSSEHKFWSLLGEGMPFFDDDEDLIKVGKPIAQRRDR